ncbi:MAG: hypothetical protein KAG94_01755 [Clostridiales bacterium]|nr:hypothetical protein [Clostridiales bacterium]
MIVSKNQDFIPKKISSWWCTIEDILWSEKKIVDKIKRNAEAFAKADIDTAINFGFHVRFDFSNYFGQLHGYYANVCEELHKYGIRFMDHYSCNHVQRPRNIDEFNKVHKNHRHHVLLFHDQVAAKHAQYEGHYFNDLCEVDLRDGSRGYSKTYQLEVFCHNNPGFLDMHQKYLKRLLSEVPMDGIEVDDMCDYAGLVTCGCKYCRDRFKKEYGQEIPSYDDKSFWGDISNNNEYMWGNYNNHIFRDWLRMKSDSVAEHLKMIKETVGEIPLMTCCSSSGPIILNSLSLNLEKMAPHLDFFVLENCGIDISSVNWTKMDAEALHQKDIATKNKAPALAISYSIYEQSAYLGWALSRFWGVGSWSSTLNQRLEKDPDDAKEIFDIISKYNNWETANSNYDCNEGVDIEEVRLVSNKYCRENGWRDDSGFEQWDKIKKWSDYLMKRNIGYRVLRANELSNAKELCSNASPLILDGLGCLSDDQYVAISKYLQLGGIAYISLPFGTHDEKGFKRSKSLFHKIDESNFENLTIIETSTISNPLDKIIEKKLLEPLIWQIKGDDRWVLRARKHGSKIMIHLLNSALKAKEHPTLKDRNGNSILKEFESDITENKLVYRFNSSILKLTNIELLSPELGSKRIDVNIIEISKEISEIHLDLSNIKLYAVIQEKEQ